jgi:hypothetical protein
MRLDPLRTINGPACAFLLPLVLLVAAPAGAQSRARDEGDEPEAGGREAAPESSAAERTVWDFVHFVSPAEIVDVIDAFDDDDPFDLSFSIAYTRTLKRAKITRECRDPTICRRDDGAGTAFVDYMDIARYTQETHMLDLLLAIGIYHDLQFYTRWPLILSDTRSLAYEEGVNTGTVDNVLGGIFELPFESPERSGIDWFAVGFSWAPFNQERDPTEPNWVLNIEGRFGIGDLLKAADSGGDGGISRGVSELRVGTALSRRFKYLEPYSGLFATVGFPKYDAGYHYKDPVEGQINTMPPIVGTLIFGMEIIPWENLERFQKFWIGLEIDGTFHSEGRDYSELFDALGTSQDERLTYMNGRDPVSHEPVLEGPCQSAGNCWANQSFARDPLYRFTGMTDQENYGTFGFKLTLGIQAAKYVKFTAGIGFAHDQEHYITFTDECNSEVDGQCQNFGPQYNPMTREAIDAPGNRFRVQETTIFDVFAGVTAMF